MKLRLISLMLVCLITLAVSLCSCGDSNGKTTDPQNTGDTTASDTTGGDSVVRYDYDLTPYVTLGQYMGIEYVPNAIAEVTETDIQNRIDEVLAANVTSEEVTSRGAQMGDTVTVDYVGKISGIAFEGGTASDQTFVLGEATLIEGFQEGLVGVKTGESVELNLTFPDPYETNPDYAGKDCVFTITMTKIEQSIMPELNDAFVATVSDCKTVDEYRQSIADEIKSEREDTERVNKVNTVWASVQDKATVISCPQVELDRYINETLENMQEYAEGYNMTVEDFLTQYYGKTLDDFKTECAEMATMYVEEELVLNAVIHAENITVSEEKYQEGLAGYAERYGTTPEEMESQYGRDAIEQSVLWDTTLEYLADNAKIVEEYSETTAEDTTVSDTTAADTTASDDTTAE